MFGGWITGQWIITDLDPGTFHPGYVLPTVAGGFVAAAGAGEFGLRGLGWLSFGVGIVSWLVLTSLTFSRLLFGTMLPAALMPTVIFETAPAALAGTAYFELHGPVPDPAVYGITGYLVLLVLVQLRLLPVYGRLTFTPGFWSFTFAWAAIAGFALTWLHIERPAGQTVFAVLVLAAASLLIGAIAARSLVAIARHPPRVPDHRDVAGPLARHRRFTTACQRRSGAGARGGVEAAEEKVMIRSLIQAESTQRPQPER